MIYYNLAYGSNMSLNRLLARLPNAKRIGVATVNGFQLSFDKKGFDDSGKCNANQTDDPDDVLYGVLYQITGEEKAILDNIEGPRYDCLAINVTTESVTTESATTESVITKSGDSYDAYCYIANTFDGQLLPYDWYVRHVLTGAEEAQLPDWYIDKIRFQQSKEDPDQSRAQREFSI
jgi:hypothetical protein